jgi:hypothetical protein
LVSHSVETAGLSALNSLAAGLFYRCFKSSNFWAKIAAVFAKGAPSAPSVRPKRVRKHEQKIYRLTQTRIDNNLTVPVFMYGGVLQCLPGASPINP